jgi:hypothetical protein
VTAKTYTAQLSYKGVFSAASIAGVFNASALATNILSIKGKKIVDPRRPKILTLSTTPITTLVADHEAYLPVTLTGTNLTGRQAVFSLVNEFGTAVYTSAPINVSDSFHQQLHIDRATLNIPYGDYTVRAAIVGSHATASVGLVIAENLDSYWRFKIELVDGNLVLVARFELGGYDTVEIVGAVYVNGVLTTNYTVNGNEIRFPDGPTSGRVTIRFAGLKYNNLFPGFILTLEETVDL